MPPTSPAPDRTEKLVSLTYALTTTRLGYTKAQLRSMVDDYADLSDEAFERKFERDKETLRRLGVAVVDGKGADDADAERRYRVLPRDYPLPSLRLTPLEAAVLGLASRVVAGGTLGEQARRAAARLGVDAPEEPTFSAAVDTGEEHLDALIRHAALGHPVRFRYRTADGRLDTREVMPWGLGHRHGHWYLAAGDTRRDGERMFRLDRIEGAVARLSPRAELHVPEAYGRPDRFRMAEALDRLDLGQAEHAARVLVPHGAGGTLAARATGRTVTPRGDELALAYRTVDELAPEIAAQGARVLSPADLAAAVVERLRSAVSAHEEAVPAYRLTAQRGGKVPAEVAVSRALDLVAFVVGNGVSSTSAVMERFGLDRAGLDAELTRLRFCGVPNGTHDELLDVEWDDENVSISNAEVLAKPINLNLSEAASLLIGLDAMASAPAGSYGGAAIEAIDGVAARLRSLRPELADFEQLVAVRAAAGERAELVTTLTEAAQRRRVVRLDYAAGSRPGPRDVEPVSLFDAGRVTYLQAFSRAANAPRTFRLDRIVGLTVLSEVFEPTPERLAAVRAQRAELGGGSLEVDVLWRGAAGAAAAAHTPLRSTRTEAGLITRVRIREAEYLTGLAASHGGDVAVLAPTELRQAVLRSLRSRLEAAADTAHEGKS